MLTTLKNVDRQMKHLMRALEIGPCYYIGFTGCKEKCLVKSINYDSGLVSFVMHGISYLGHIRDFKQCS